MNEYPQEDPAPDSLTLRFRGVDEDGSELQELRAAHVSETLRGLVGISSDFDKAGAFGDGPAGSEVLVKPAQAGSFIIEVFRVVQDNPDVVAYAGIPTLSQVIYWATKSVRAEPMDVSYLEDGRVKINWQDNSVDVVPKAAYEELQKRRRRRKKQLREILAPLSDERVENVEVYPHGLEPELDMGAPEPAYTLERDDYDAARPDDEADGWTRTFEVEAQMSAIDFDDPERWRVKTVDRTRNVKVEDNDFLGRVATGLAIRKTDIFRLEVREDTVRKNGRTRSKWTVLRVANYRRAAHDDDA